MEDSRRYIINIIFVSVFFFALSFYAWVKPRDEISVSELRKLASFPEFSIENVVEGSFFDEFESYSLDQFPFRDNFRSIKAYIYLFVLKNLDNNGIYIEDGSAVKMEYPLNMEQLNYGISRLNNVYNSFIKGTDAKVYVSIIPDKNYYFASSHGSLSFDYDLMFETIKDNMDYANYIDVEDLLNKDSYYTTDIHWNPVYITEVANRFSSTMDFDLAEDLYINTIDTPFYGIYYGQSALNVKPDTIQYYTNASIENAVVTDLEHNKIIKVYNYDKLGTRSPYDFFLGGPLSLVTIENPEATSSKELVVFRDSFASSLVPYFINGYKKITLVDIRYLPGDVIGKYIEFHNQDVLFIYSTSVLNNGNSLK